MVMTILEAHVASEKWAVLEQAYKAGTVSLPSVIVQTFLVQNSADPTMWRIITQWRSRAALEEYRLSVETPGGVLMFREAGAEPTLSIFDIRVHVQGDA
ncbi:MAG TPA: hypothetical protein VF177_05280 [Anaerolineae bacterium]